MEADRIATIEDWPTPKSVKHVQELMGFTDCYLNGFMVEKDAKVTAPIGIGCKLGKKCWLERKTRCNGQVGSFPCTSGKRMPHNPDSSSA
jgi:hypothetical protein